MSDDNEALVDYGSRSRGGKETSRKIMSDESITLGGEAMTGGRNE